MKKLTHAEILYSISGATLSALILAAILQSIFSLQGVVFWSVVAIGFLGSLITLLYMMASDD